MVSQTLQRTVGALNAEDRADLLDYMQRTAPVEAPLSDEQVALISSRDAEMDADSSLGIPAHEFFARLRAKSR